MHQNNQSPGNELDRIRSAFGTLGRQNHLFSHDVGMPRYHKRLDEDMLTGPQKPYTSESLSIFANQRLSESSRISKDGTPRKVRELRAKLLEWTDKNGKLLFSAWFGAVAESVHRLPSKWRQKLSTKIL